MNLVSHDRKVSGSSGAKTPLTANFKQKDSNNASAKSKIRSNAMSLNS
jgi:hypothetical protein